MAFDPPWLALIALLLLRRMSLQGLIGAGQGIWRIVADSGA
jgi:hypothetical protein